MHRVRVSVPQSQRIDVCLWIMSVWKHKNIDADRFPRTRVEHVIVPACAGHILKITIVPASALQKDKLNRIDVN